MWGAVGCDHRRWVFGVAALAGGKLTRGAESRQRLCASLRPADWLRFTPASCRSRCVTFPCCPRRRRFGEEVVGFRYVASGPLVRSSYRAGEFFTEVGGGASVGRLVVVVDGGGW